MADHLTLTVYGADDTTALFEVGTDPAHANPYLARPDHLVASEVDLLNGGGRIGEVTVSIIDPQTGATKADRWLTSRLGVPQGQAGEGHSQLNGRRARLATTAGQTLLDGVVSRVSLNESFAGFTLSLKDIRERPRKTPVFVSAAQRQNGPVSAGPVTGGPLVAAPTVFPRGRMEGYGKLPVHDFLPTGLQRSIGWTIPPTLPLSARVDSFGNQGNRILNLEPTEWPTAPNENSGVMFSPKLVLTEAMREVGSRFESRENAGASVDVFTDVRILWRALSTDPWTEVEVSLPAAPWEWNVFHQFENQPVEYKAENGLTRGSFPVVRSINLGVVGTLPAVGATVEFLLVYIGEPTEAYPFTFQGTAGEFIAALHDGEFSDTSPRTRYDAAAVAALTDPVLVRITEKRDSIRDVEEEVYRALGQGAAVIDGLLTPVSSRLPSPGASLPQITDEVAQPIPGWEHGTDSAVTEVVVRYRRDFRRGALHDPTGEHSAGDGVGSREVIHRTPAPDWAVDLLGEHPHEIDAWMLRALGGTFGESRTGDVMDETGAQLARGHGRHTLDRWLFGGQTSACKVRSLALQPGDWVEDRRSWRPNYNTLVRGGPVLAQVQSVEPLDEAWSAITLVDAGPSAQPLAQPTLGALTVDSDGRVTAPISAVPAGADAEIQYATNATKPAAGSELWRIGDRRTGNGNLLTPPMPAGATVWVQARTVEAGRRPSDWTAGASVVIPSEPRVTDVGVAVYNDGSVLVVWDRNVAAEGVRLHYEVHAIGATPTLPNTVDVDADAGEYSFPAGTVPIGEQFTVDVEPWTQFPIAGTAGARVRVSDSRTVPVVAPDIAFKSGTMSLSGTNVIADIVLQVVESSGVSGTLSLWTNKASTADPDPTGAADQTLTVAGGQTVGPAAAAPDVVATALDDVLVMSVTRPGARKMIYARWDSVEGQTTGIKGFPLSRGLLTLEEVDPTKYVGNVPTRIRKRNAGKEVDADAIIDRVNDTLDAVPDGTTYGRISKGYLDTNNRPDRIRDNYNAVDRLAQNLFDVTRETLDNVPEGTTYQKVKASALTTGEVDLSKVGVRNKNAQYIVYSDASTVESLKPAEAGAQKNPPYLTGVGIAALDVPTGVDVTAKWNTSGTVTDVGHDIEIEYWHDNGGTGGGFTAIATATEVSPVTNKSKTINHAAGTGDDLYKVVVKLVDSSGNVIDEKSSRWEIVAL